MLKYKINRNTKDPKQVCGQQTQVQIIIFKMRAKSISNFLKTQSELLVLLISSTDPLPDGPLFKLESPSLRAWLNNAAQWILVFRLESKETSFISIGGGCLEPLPLTATIKMFASAFLATVFLPGLLICTNSEPPVCPILNNESRRRHWQLPIN